MTESISGAVVPEDIRTEQTILMYDRIPGTFAGHFSGFRSTVPDIQLAHEIADIPYDRGRVVEIGCGDGRDAETAFVPNSEVYTGFDPSEGFLELARDRFPGAREDMFRLGYAETTDYPDMDIAMSINSILHVPEERLPAVFQRVAEALSSGGVFSLITKVEDKYNEEAYPDRFPVGDEDEMVEGTRVFYHHTVDGLTEQAKKAGLVVAHLDIDPVDVKNWDWLSLAVQKPAA